MGILKEKKKIHQRKEVDWSQFKKKKRTEAFLISEQGRRYGELGMQVSH